MAISTAFVVHGINTPSNFYSQLANATPTTNVGTFAVIPAGHTQPLFIGTNGVQPTMEFGTQQVATALAEFGILGVDLSGGNTDFYLKKMDEQGTRVADATAEHIRLRAAQAFGYISDVSVSHGGLAVASGAIVCAYDGTNAPIVPSGSAALAGTPTGTENFTLGPVSLNGSTLAGVDDMRIALNPSPTVLTADGEVYPTFVAMETISPEVVLTSYTNLAWSTYGIDGTALTAFTGYLRAKDADGENVADGSSSHVRFTSSGGKIIVQQTTGSGSTPASVSIRIPLRAASAAANALTITTSTTIT